MKKKIKYIIPVIVFVALMVIFIRDIVAIWPDLTSGSEQRLNEALMSLGWRGALVLTLIQACLVMAVFIPSEFIQIVSGVTYGVAWGSIINLIGILVGATIIYMLVKICKVSGKELEDSSAYQTINAVSKKKYNTFLTGLILFILPAVPYGVICYYISNKKIRYWQYASVCVVGNIPSVFIDTCLGSAFTAVVARYMTWVVIAILAFTLIMVLVISKIGKRRANKLIYGQPNPTLNNVLDIIDVKKPDAKAFSIMRRVSKFITRKNKIEINNEEIKYIPSPCLYLAAHMSKTDIAYSLQAIPNKNPNIIMNYYYFNKPIMSGALIKLGVIPKRMFTPDVRTVKKMISARNKGLDMLMYPAGRLSISGTDLDMPEGLEKLIKKLGIPVVTIIAHGAYLTNAKWMRSRRTGKIQIDCKVCLTKEEIEENNSEYILNKIKQNLTFDEFEWAKTNNVSYRGKSLCKGVENILYICPHCHAKYTLKGVKNNIICTNCGKVVEMNNNYEFVKGNAKGINNIKEWYNYQIEQEKINISNPDYKLSCEVTTKTYKENGKGMIVAGVGRCELTKQGLHYMGTFKDQEQDFIVPPENLQALLFGCNEDFEMYHDGEFYYFVPQKNKLQCVEWAIISELIHD